MLLGRLLNTFIRTGELTVIDADGRPHRFGGGEPAITVRLHDRSLHWRMFIRPELAAGEAYMDGTLTIENATIYGFLDLIGRNVEIGGSDGGRLASPLRAIRHLPNAFQRVNTPARARRNAAHHYDLTLDLYDMFLDSDRQYSCAYFRSEGESLEDAQRNKRRHIAAKLLLQPGMRVLDIGSGWGGLALYLADRFESAVVGLTLSKEQLRVAEQRAASADLAERTHFALRDYREETGTYDRIVSVGMFEHVGLQNYDAFFEAVRDRLADEGIALLHTIGTFDPAAMRSAWVRKYIFPGGYLPTLSEAAAAIERSGLRITDVEVLRGHYAETLRLWRERFLANRDRAEALYDTRFCRMWEYYLAAFEMAFRHMKLCVFQIQMTKRDEAAPLTRDYMLEAEQRYAAQEGELSADRSRVQHGTAATAA